MSTNDVEIDLEKHEVFSSAIAGLPKVAELIASFPFEDRQRALEAAKQSYLETARGLGAVLTPDCFSANTRVAPASLKAAC